MTNMRYGHVLITASNLLLKHFQISLSFSSNLCLFRFNMIAKEIQIPSKLSMMSSLLSYIFHATGKFWAIASRLLMATRLVGGWVSQVVRSPKMMLKANRLSRFTSSRLILHPAQLSLLSNRTSIRLKADLHCGQSTTGLLRCQAQRDIHNWFALTQMVCRRREIPVIMNAVKLPLAVHFKLL